MGTYLGVLYDSIAIPDDARQRIPSFDDANEDEGPAEAEGSLRARHSPTHFTFLIKMAGSFQI